jgi:3-hydroxyisobutyrate dehydrogenase-like beta-hydroxyacid dehydrogenase
LCAVFKERGIDMLDAPVAGGVEGASAGVDLETLAGVIGVSTGTCRAIVDTFPKQLFRRNFENPGFSTSLSAKDTHLAIELAHELDVPMHIGEIIERDKQEALRCGWGPLSPDVFVRLQEERAGVVLSLEPATAEAAVTA